MSSSEKKIKNAWSVLESLTTGGSCGIIDCKSCHTEPDKCPNASDIRNWLLDSGFPASRPRVWTLEELSALVIDGRSNIDLFIEQHVEAIKCTDCGKTLYRERRMICDDCCGIYPVEKWASGEPCGCGNMDASYCGRAVNRNGQREFRQCETKGCWWNGLNHELSVNRLAELAEEATENETSTPL